MKVGLEAGFRVGPVKASIGGTAGYSVETSPEHRLQTSQGHEANLEAKVPASSVKAGGSVEVSQVTSTLTNDYQVTGKEESKVSTSGSLANVTVSSDRVGISGSAVAILGPSVEVGVDRQKLAQANIAAKKDPQTQGIIAGLKAAFQSAIIAIDPGHKVKCDKCT